jgi:hypothetical protein
LVGFAKALILGTRLTAHSTLAASHGLRDISAPCARLTELRASIEARGTFFEFNDVAASLNRLSYIDEKTNTVRVQFPTTASADMVGLQVNLKDVLSRLAPLSKLYQYTFTEMPLTEALEPPYSDQRYDYLSTRIVDSKILGSREALASIMRSWRERFPVLCRWTVVEANPAWGATYITVANLDRGDMDDLTPEVLPEIEPNRFVSVLRGRTPAEHPRVPIEQLFAGIGGGYSGRTHAIAALHGHHLSEYSLVYVGLFLLSSLVRYRPDTWSHAVSRSSLQDRPVDDQALSLIQEFLDVAQVSIPSLVVKVLNPNEDTEA